MHSSRLLSKNLKIKIYKTIILPVVLCGCETWSFTLRYEHRLTIYENRILRREFEPERHANGEWRRLYNEKLNDLYRSPNIVRMIKSRGLRWADHVARILEGRSSLKIIISGPTTTGNRPLRIPRIRCEDSFRMNFKEIRINSRNWVDSAQDWDYGGALVNAALILRVP